MSPHHGHRLEGLEPDNLLAFLALLGLLRALDAADAAADPRERLRARACWDLDAPPLRPRIVTAAPVDEEAVLDAACRGIDLLAAGYAFEDRKDLDHTRAECRDVLKDALAGSGVSDRGAVDLLAALMSDGALKEKDEAIEPTPLCLLFGQGHQHFLERLAAVPALAAPAPRRRRPAQTAQSCLAQALFAPWHRGDDTPALRWDPAEDVRYALRAGDSTDPAYATGTQHGANRLAAIGLGALWLAPQVRRGRARPSVLGGAWGPEGFSFSWPIWRPPATRAAIRGLLSHPALGDGGGLEALGVDHVMTARRISVGKYMSFTRARAG